MQGRTKPQELIKERKTMGKIFACCGHEVFGNQAFDGYVWYEYNYESSDGKSLCCGNLCPNCVDAYNAVKSTGNDERDRELLKDKQPVGLIDILSRQYNKPIKTENIAEIEWETLEL